MRPARLVLKVNVLAVVSCFCIAQLTNAGPVTIRPPNGARVSVNVTYRNGETKALGVFKDDGPGDEDKRPGYFTITVPRESEATRIDVRSLGVVGNANFNVVDFGVAGVRAFEPIDVFAFGSPLNGTILLATIDAAEYALSGNPFTEGDILPVTNGTAAGASGVVFRDASALFVGGSFFDVFVDLDPTILNGLPRYTGDAQVLPSIAFRPLPAPATLALMVLGLSGLAWARRRPSRKLARE